MSEGSFSSSKYETDGGLIVNIKVQPETLTLTVGGGANTAPAGDLDVGLPSAQVSKGKRSIGINCRTVSIVFDPPVEGYKPDSPIRLPILTTTRYNAITAGQTGTYKAAPVRVIGKSPESIK